MGTCGQQPMNLPTKVRNAFDLESTFGSSAGVFFKM